MNNVIMILIDSLFSDALTNKVFDENMPFVSSLMDKGFFCPTIISSGPYTDAATKSLYTSSHGLDDGGYYFQLNTAETNHYRIFKELGYETYGFFYPYYLNGRNITKYIDHSIFLSGMLFESIWDGKLKYYADLKKKRNLNDLEYCFLIKIMDVVFESWTHFYHTLDTDLKSRTLIKRLISDEQIVNLYPRIESEFNSYLKNKKDYINSILEAGYKHPLAKLEVIDASNFVDKEFLKKYVYKRNAVFLRRSAKSNKKLNKKNNKLDKRKAIKGILRFIKTGHVSEARYFINYLRCINSIKELKNSSLKKKWKNIASAGSQIDSLCDVISNRQKSKPFFASLHFLEPHHLISFFSYDSTNKDLLNREFDYLNQHSCSLATNFKGNLSYYLSLLYVDFCLKRLFEKLKEEGLDKETTLVLFGDHGTSYLYNPIRKHMVNTFHRENYCVPLIIWNKSIQNQVVKNQSYYPSRDILKTILFYCGTNSVDSVKGSNIYSNLSCNEPVVTEYMGPGCPDMLSREVWISARDFEYTIGCKVKLSDELTKKEIVCIYDRKSDPDELVNHFADDKYIDKTQYLFNIIKRRLKEIKINFDLFVDSILNNM